MKFEEWLAQQDGVIEVDCGCVTTEAFYHWMRVAYEAGNSQVIPDGIIAAINRLLDSDGSRGCYDAMVRGEAREEIERLLTAAPTAPDGWIPVSEQKPDCWCRTCRPVVLNDMRFVVCPDCGNKRCPRANDHRNACTGSNEPGQEGSAYPADPQEVPDGK